MKRFFIAAALLATIALAGFAAWRFFPLGQTYFTDANNIKEPAATAQVRDVLWEPPLPHAEAINAGGETYEPRLSNDGTTLYFVRGKAGGNADIYTARHTAQGWTDPQPMTEINSPADDLGPEISADGETLYFYSNRAGGQGSYDVWVSRRGTDGAWREPANLGLQVNSQFNDYGPALTGDGRTLYFSSNRPLPGDDRQPNPGAWQATLREEFFTRTYDLYAAPLTDSGAGNAQPLTLLNTSQNEGAPAVSSFGDFLYFASDRPGGSGGFDLYRARRLRDELQSPTNLGSSVNTFFHELDPALSMNGFGLDFSSNRPSAEQGAASPHEYKLYHTNSREVFSETERPDRVPMDWAAIWRAVGPNLLWALLALALLLVMLLLFKGGQNRKLNLLTKCVLASLAAHLLLMLLFNVWEVAATVAGEIRGNGGGGGIRVALSPSGGGGITAQLGGSLSEITAPRANIETIKAAVGETASPISQVDIPLTKKTLEFPAGVASPINPQEAIAPSIALQRPDVAPHVDISRSPSVALNVPAVQSASPTTEAVIQMGAAQTSIARQQSLLAVSNENSGVSEPAAPTRTQLPASTSSTRFGLAEVARDSAISMTGTLNDSTVLPALPSTSPYRVALATDFPVAQASGGTATETHSKLPTTGGGSAVRQALSDQVEGNSMGGQNAQAPAPPSGNLAGLCTGRSSLGAVAAKDADIPVGNGDAKFSGHGPSGLGEQLALGAEGKSPKGFGSLELALPGIGNAVAGSPSPAQADQTEKGGLGSMRPGSPTMSRGPLSNEITGSPTATSSNSGAGGSTLPRSDVFASAGPGIPGSPTGSKIGGALASITLDAIVGAYNRDGGATPTLASPRAPAAFELNIPTELAPPENPYPQRSADDRLETVKRMGGSEKTEAAVALALEWLARHQSPDGHWDAGEFDTGCGECGGETKIAADHALTGLGMLCFLGAGHTHTQPGPYQDNVQRALNWLVSRQKPDGDLRGGKETMYTQGIATIALAESYAMTADAKLGDHVQRAVSFIYRARNPQAGGWRYDPGQAGDTSVLGWQVMALKSAARAGVPVPENAFSHARAWLDRVSSNSDPGLYSYQPNEEPTPSMTAEGLFVQQLLGLTPSEPRMLQSVDFVLDHLPHWDKEAPTYFWYYASLALFQHQGDAWRTWNTAISKQLIDHQRRDGRAAGSWDPSDDWSRLGGRVYQTALCTLMLEVYYRYLPMYGQDALAVQSATTDSPATEEIVGAIRGTVTDKTTHAPLSAAVVRLVLSDRETLTATTDNKGKYTLDVPATPDFFALSASLDPYVPQTVSVKRARLEANKKLVVNFELEPHSENALVTEAAPDVHHLGDDRFGGDINSQFQKKSEGAKFSIDFEIAPDSLATPLERAEVRLMAKGVQRRHKIFVNDKLLERRLDKAPEDGGFGEFVAPFEPALLTAGTNTLRVQALPSEDDIDDFEFVNIRIYLVQPPGPNLGAGTSLNLDSGTTGSQ